MSDARAVLAGVKVVEFSQNAAVPQCGRLLAGMGADVVKIEPLAGDSMRHLAKLGPTEARAYASINPGKRAMTLDLTSVEAAPVVEGLLRWADIALVGLKQSDVARYGLDWERAHGLNPRLVELVFTSFGPEGPDAAQGGYDVLVQALSGLGYVMNRSADGVPLTTRPAFIDFASGMMATVGVLAALRVRDATGDGQLVDGSLLGTAIALGTPLLSSFAADDEAMAAVSEELALLAQAGADFDAQRAHYEARVIAVGGIYRLYFRHYLTADGLITIAGMSPGLIDRFHDLTGVDRPPKGSNPGDPLFDAAVEQAERLFATRASAEWLAELRAAGYPCSRYNSPMEAVRDPQVRANDYTVDLVHPEFGPYTTPGMPIQISGAPTAIAGPSPRLGEHTHDVLIEIGLVEAEIAALSDAGIVSGCERD